MQLSLDSVGGCAQDFRKTRPFGFDPAPSSAFETQISTPCFRHLGFKKKKRKENWPAVLQQFSLDGVKAEGVCLSVGKGWVAQQCPLGVCKGTWLVLGLLFGRNGIKTLSWLCWATSSPKRVSRVPWWLCSEVWEVAKDQQDAGGRGQDVPSQGTLQDGAGRDPLAPPWASRGVSAGATVGPRHCSGCSDALQWGPLAVLVCSGTGGMWPSLSLLSPDRVMCGGGHQSPD